MIVMLGEIPGPVWKDECKHKEGTYLCSFDLLETFHGVTQNNKYDVYIFDLGSIGFRDHICIRYGNEGSEYYSPGSLLEMFSSAHMMPPYLAASRLVMRLGHINFTNG